MTPTILNTKEAIAWTIDTARERYLLVRDYMAELIKYYVYQYLDAKSNGVADPEHPINFIRSIKRNDRKTHWEICVRLY